MTRALQPILATCACALLLAACQTVQTTRTGASGVDRPQRLAYSSEQFNQEAAQQYRALLTKAQQAGKLNRNPAQLARTRSIAQRLIAQTPAFRDDAARWNWEINLISSDEGNAWCMPGGKIAVYTGLIEQIKPSDDELAQVIGHEIAHALREHSREQASERIGTNILASSVELIGSAYGVSGLGRVANTGLQLGVGLPHSRLHETEADRIGLELAARAGYDPNAAVTLWQKMARSGGASPPPFLSTHPAPADRQADLRALAEKIRPIYLQSHTR